MRFFRRLLATWLLVALPVSAAAAPFGHVHADGHHETTHHQGSTFHRHTPISHADAHRHDADVDRHQHDGREGEAEAEIAVPSVALRIDAADAPNDCAVCGPIPSAEAPQPNVCAEDDSLCRGVPLPRGVTDPPPLERGPPR